MKTRRFKALNGAKGKDLRIVDKIAVYDESGVQIDCRIVKKDADGREYYCPTNINDKFGLFLHKPKDAIDCIRKGFGDGFQQSKLFGFTLDNVVKFIDKDYGDEIRNKTIEGWKNAQFAYGVMFSWLNSFSSGREVCKNKSLFGWDDKKEDILTFESEEAASIFIKDVIDKATDYYNEYMKLKDAETENHDEYYKKVYKPFFENIEGRMENGHDSVYWNVFYAMNREKKEGKPMYEMEIIQVVLP